MSKHSREFEILINKFFEHLFEQNNQKIDFSALNIHQLHVLFDDLSLNAIG